MIAARMRYPSLVAVLVLSSCSSKPAATPPAPTRAAKAASWTDDPAIERRVEELLGKMSLEDKIGQLNQYSNGHPTGPDTGGKNFEQLAAEGKLGSVLNLGGPKETNALQHIAVEKSRLHIPILFGLDVIHGFRTTFPIPLALASSWDPDLVQRCARDAAKGATAIGIRWDFSPMVDIARDARWGRIIEGAGEDPFLGAQIAAAYVRGYQGEHLSDPTSMAACAKHFVGYGAAEAGRDYNSTYIPERLLREIYLPPFQAAVDAGAATLMSAFNALNDVPASANPMTLGILKKEWKFKGFVVSDYTSIKETIEHGTANDGATAAKKAINAGVDMDMEGSLYLNELARLVKERKVSQQTIDDSVRRILRVKLALGLFDHPYTDENAVPVKPDIALAKQAALESFVLLANKGVLPMTAHKIAVIGPLADDADDMNGGWSVQTEFKAATLRTALEAYGKTHALEVAYEKGTEITGTSDAGFAAAVAAAKQSELVLLAVGENAGDMTGEASSRAHIDLPGNQPQLVEAIEKSGTPVVLLVFSGRPLALTPYVDGAAAVVQVWHPGMQGGVALVDALAGVANFSGRLTVSFPRSLGQLPIYYNALATGRPPIGVDLTHPWTNPDDKYKSRYIDEQNAPLYPFGYGLSYTTFQYTPVTASAATASAKALNRGAPGIAVRATVRNTGTRVGTEVVQLYIRLRGTSVALPVRELKGYERITLAPGESREVTFTIGKEQLAFWNIDLKHVVEPAALSVWIARDSGSGKPLDLVIGE